MRARLLLFLVLGLALAGAMSLLVVCEAPQAERTVSLPTRVLAPEAPLPVSAEVALERAIRPSHHEEVADKTDFSYQIWRPVEVSRLPYLLCAYYAFHYADEAG